MTYSSWTRTLCCLRETYISFYFKNTYLFIWLCWVLVVACKLLVSHVGSSFLTRDQIQAPYMRAQSLNHWSLLKLMSIELVMPSNYLILCHPLLLPSILPNTGVFSNDSVLCIKWPKYWSFSFSISPSNEYSGPISFRMDWLDCLQSKGFSRVFSHTTVQKHQFFRAHFFLIVQLSHLHMTTGKITALTRWNLVGKVMSLLFNMMSRLIIAFLQRGKRLLISWCSHYLQWFWSPKNKVCNCFHSFPIYLP